MKMIGTITTTTTKNNTVMDEMPKASSLLFPTNALDGHNEEDGVGSTTSISIVEAAAPRQREGDDESGVEDDIEFLLPSIQQDKELSRAPCPALTDALVAKQMAQLSVKDREEVYFDIHGVSGAIDEDAEPGFVDGKLNELQHELETMDATNKKAYLMALAASPDYVQNRNLRLRFLRADRFDAKLAALRYVYNFEIKLELFGSDKLGRDIVQDDLDRETLDALYCGQTQMLPQRDSAGRAIFVNISDGNQIKYSNQALMRRYFYNAMMATDDVETQRKGLVIVMYAIGTLGGGGGGGKEQEEETRTSRGEDENDGGSMIERRGVGKIWKVIGPMCRAVPLKIVGLHFCYNNLAWVPILSTFRVASDLLWRLRFRAHRGSHSECMYNLQTFGIPTEIFPVDKNGRVLSEKYTVFLTKRRELEKKGGHSNKNTAVGTASEAVCIVALPNARDVLLGRGRGYFNHVGNIRYRGIIEDLQGKYNTSQRGGKKKIMHDIVQMIHKSGGRFLKEYEAGWAVVGADVAALKVSHSFRGLRGQQLASRMEGGKSSDSSTKNNKHSKSPTTRGSGGVGTTRNGDSPFLKRTRAA